MLKNILSMTELRIFPKPPIIDERIRFFPSKQELFLRTSFQVLRVLQTLTFYDIWRIISPIIFLPKYCCNYHQPLNLDVVSWIKSTPSPGFLPIFFTGSKASELGVFSWIKSTPCPGFLPIFCRTKNLSSLFFRFKSKVSKFGCSKDIFSGIFVDIF